LSLTPNNGEEPDRPPAELQDGDDRTQALPGLPNPRGAKPIPDDGSVIIEETIQHSGPLPMPQQLRQYDDIVPGAAERIIRMAEGQGAHRQRLEVQDQRLQGRGLTFAFIIAMSGVVGGLDRFR